VNHHRSVFVSTAIPYVNAAPHLGFALEVVLADAIARHARARSRDVCFVSGTDDHSLKNVRAAEEAAVAPSELVERGATQYRALERVLGASYDDFVRTSADPRHAKAVLSFWNACLARGDLEKRTYRGLYCAGCEQFFGEGEVCSEHGTALEIVEEENWFFRLSRYERPIRDALSSGAIRIHPAERANEILRVLESGLEDVSVSRSRGRARGWGIPVPEDDSQTIYVWFDALASYVTGGDGAFRDAERRVHVLGKGIARFHALLWPALLLAAGLPLPTDLVVHGYVTIDGRKIGKSLGNAIPPDAFVSKLGRDALRWFLLRHVGPVRDADVSRERITRVYESELADGLGNLVARTLTLRSRCRSRPELRAGGIDPSGDALLARARVLDAEVDAALDRFALDEALDRIFTVVVAANGHLAHTAPWGDATDDSREAKILAAVIAIEHVGRALAPFLPETSARIAQALAAGRERPPILFPKKRR
jgi:methionyl-tRNA synthetase